MEAHDSQISFVRLFQELLAVPMSHQKFQMTQIH